MNAIINNARNQFDGLVLTDDYRMKQFTKNFDTHLSVLLDTTVKLSSSPTILGKKDSMSDQLYWESEAFILEKLDDLTDTNILDELDDLEDHIYAKIKSELGNNYDDKDDKLNMIIDNSVHDYMLSVKFNFFSRKDSFTNPWESASDIIIENQVLFMFSKDAEKLKSMGFKIKSEKESELISDQKINIVAKGKRKDYSYSYVRDLIGLRNTLLDIMEDDKSYGVRAMKVDAIIAKIRLLGVSREELSDNNIKSWIIYPLKRTNKIGSHKEGYFLLKDCDSVGLSYQSHFVNLKGYFKTLENHRKLASQFSCGNDFDFEKHITFFSDKK